MERAVRLSPYWRIEEKINRAPGLAGNYGRVKMSYFNDPAALMKLIGTLADGFQNTLYIFFMTLLFSLPLGLLVALGRMSRHKWLSAPIGLYILVMRGTPLMLQIFAVHFMIPNLLGINLDRMLSTIIAFVLNYAAYFAEIYRGGILAIPQGQYVPARCWALPGSRPLYASYFPRCLSGFCCPPATR